MRMKMIEQIYISWQDFHQHAKQLAQKLKTIREFNKIIAISRGGLIPAGIIAYELDIRNTQAINISSYDGEEQRKAENVVIKADIDDVDEKTLIIDDLSDTGKTFQLVRQLFPQAYLASVYAKPTGTKYVDMHAVAVPDKWLVFPWDI